jgi:hypothetical protein
VIFGGKYKEAAVLISSNILARPVRQMPYETVGDLMLKFEEAETGTRSSKIQAPSSRETPNPKLQNEQFTDYQRELNLEESCGRD